VTEIAKLAVAAEMGLAAPFDADPPPDSVEAWVAPA
jgi:hypothetical protein